MKKLLFAAGILSIAVSCVRDDEGGSTYPETRTFVDLNERLPGWFTLRIVEPPDNPTTLEGIAFGKELFYDPILSADGTQACASCHMQKNGFAEDRQFSVGIDGIEGNRNAMPTINLGLQKIQSKFFWDGRSNGLENQAFEPVKNPIEMHNTWKNVAKTLNANLKYREMCFRAFGSRTIDSNKVVKAIAQFERSILSVNSKYDRFRTDEVNNPLTYPEREGLKLFRADREALPDGTLISPGADCFHCHGEEVDFSDGLFHNNGLDLIPDSGRARVTKNPNDIGKFRTPTLRNLKFTAPYMHDGRFKTLDEVIDFYSEGLNAHSINIDVLMKNKDIGGVRLTPEQKAQLKAFLLSLTDDEFINNPDYSDPNQ